VTVKRNEDGREMRNGRNEHGEGVAKHVRLVSSSLRKALEEGAVVVLLQLVLVGGVSAASRHSRQYCLREEKKGRERTTSR
jgi:hypothetical protein